MSNMMDATRPVSLLEFNLKHGNEYQSRFIHRAIRYCVDLPDYSAMKFMGYDWSRPVYAGIVNFQIALALGGGIQTFRMIGECQIYASLLCGLY